MKQYLEACRVVTTHGVAGEVKVELWCDDAAFLSRFKQLYRGENGERPIELLKVRPQKNMALLTFAGVEDLETARALVGTVFYISRAEAKLPAGHYFQADLLGCKVKDAVTGREYGVIRQVSHPAAQDIYTVETPEGATSLFPAVKPFLEKVDIEGGQVLVRPIPGMFDPPQDGDKA